jgi:death-on-curing family protein
MHQPTSQPQPNTHLNLAPTLHQALEDLADATGRSPEDLLRDFGTAAYADLYEQAAALLHALATNHPLVDGNKRTAWLAAAVFLAVNGVDLADVDQDKAYDLVIDVASGAEGDVGAIAEVLRGLAGQPV